MHEWGVANVVLGTTAVESVFFVFFCIFSVGVWWERKVEHCLLLLLMVIWVISNRNLDAHKLSETKTVGTVRAQTFERSNPERDWRSNDVAEHCQRPT